MKIANGRAPFDCARPCIDNCPFLKERAHLCPGPAPEGPKKTQTASLSISVADRQHPGSGILALATRPRFGGGKLPPKARPSKRLVESTAAQVRRRMGALLGRSPPECQSGKFGQCRGPSVETPYDLVRLKMRRQPTTVDRGQECLGLRQLPPWRSLRVRFFILLASEFETAGYLKGGPKKSWPSERRSTVPMCLASSEGAEMCQSSLLSASVRRWEYH
jgi:hypothetical protein